MTDDPFQWRYDSDDEDDIKKGYYHRGLDIGEYSREARGGGGDYDAVTGEGIYAATDGVLRVFNDDLQNISVLHCPSDDVPLHAQFHLVEKSLSSVWSQSIKTDTLSGSFNEGSLPDEVLCTGIATPASGRVAVLTYERPDGLQVVTKYGHLFVNGFPEDIVAELASNAEVCEPMVRDGVRCKIDFNKSVSVRQGQRIATIGNSEFGRESNITDVGFDQHVHFEMLYLSGPGHEGLEYKRVISQPWGAAKHCGPKYVHRIPSQTPYTSHDCTWRGARPRELGPALDVEAYLPPLPASSVPKNARNVVTDGQSGRVTTSKHVMEVEGIELQRAGSVTSLIVDLSVAFWRPSFYAQYYSNIRNEDPGERGQISRTGRAGIASTGPGVTGYGTDIIAASPGKSDVLCGGGSFQPAPADSSAATDGDGNGEDESESEGELPRQTREVRLSQTNGPCVVYVLTTNSLYPTPEVLLVPRVDDLYRRNIAISDPKATLTWVTELSAGTNVVRDARALIGDALDLYTFTAYAGYTYSFCTYPSTENVCRDESSGDNDAQLLIVGPAGEVTKPNDQRDENGLTWTAPKSSSAKTTYTLVVRRRARFEGTEADYSYRLKYTIEEIGSCALLNPVEVPVCIPPKPAPSVSSRTHNTVTVSWPRPTGAMSYQTNRLPADASCDTEGVKSTFTPHSADAAGGVRGAGNQDLQYTFPGLTASISYTLCVRSVRTISPSFVLESDWVSVSTTTKAEPLPKPGGTSVTDIGQNSMTLNWGEVADAGGYKVKRTGSSSTWTLPSTRRSFTFTGLTSDFRYTLYVQALPKAGSTKVASAWARESRRTDSAPPTPIPRQPIDCLSSTDPGDVTYTSGCGFVPASSLLAVLNQRNSDVCAILHWRGGKWLRYGLTTDGEAIPGSNDFQINPGNVLTLGNCGSGSGGVSGASGLEAPSCPDAVKPETGPAVIDADASSCTTVRGGGAVQISRGEYTLNVSLASDRDWFAFAPASYTGSSAGAFLFLDLSTGGWIALYPPDGVELERHTPADAAALPALLDAIAASASTPATE